MELHYVCVVCGYTRPTKVAKCPECNTPDSFEVSGLRSLANVGTEAAERVSTGLDGLDRVLGGGIVKGSIVLLGGLPGLGKSTLLTQMAINVADEGRRVAYISAEESLSKMRIRADRLTDDAH